MSVTFTDRHVELVTLRSKDGHHSVTWSTGWGNWVPEEVHDQLVVGQDYIFETKGFNQIGGIRLPDSETWLLHNSDEYFEQQRRESLERIKRERAEPLYANREDWKRREDALPVPLRDRLRRFRANGGDHFDFDGWGYELAASELAVLYLASNAEDSPEIEAYAEAHGTSGNQHGFAKLVARCMLGAHPASAEEIINLPSALTPLTGDPDYSKSDPS